MSMMDQIPLLRRKPRQAPHLLVLAGVFACGVAGGLVEFLALQRSRLKLRQQRGWDAGHR